MVGKACASGNASRRRIAGRETSKAAVTLLSREVATRTQDRALWQYSREGQRWGAAEACHRVSSKDWAKSCHAVCIGHGTRAEAALRLLGETRSADVGRWRVVVEYRERSFELRRGRGERPFEWEYETEARSAGAAVDAALEEMQRKIERHQAARA